MKEKKKSLNYPWNLLDLLTKNYCRLFFFFLWFLFKPTPWLIKYEIIMKIKRILE